MATDVTEIIGRIVLSTTNITKEQFAQAKADAPAPNELLKALVAKKMLSVEEAKKIGQAAKQAMEGPRIPGYTIVRKLGEGGMGAVYQAVQESMGRDVALKILAKHLSDNSAFVDRFRREARSSATLDHPNVVRGFDVGEAGGCHYFAMEFVNGFSVKDLLDKQEKLDIGDAFKITRDVAEALIHAQEHKMIHRDIKPDNIMVTTKGQVKLADLGLAKQMDDENSMTQTGSGFGTPYYMPPEQARNAKYVDGRSDIYALGATLYRMVTGLVPFDGETAMEVLVAKEKGIYPKPSSLNKDLPGNANLIIDKMMAKIPEQRYQTAEELVADLDRFGLHNDQLSFVQGDNRPAPKKAAPKSGGAKASGPPSGGAVATKSKTVESTTKAKSDPGEPEMWYLNYKDARGKAVKTKLHTARVKHMIDADQLDETVEASRSPNGPFRRLGAFPEFEPLFRSRVARKQAEKKSGATAKKMSDLVANFDEEQKAHKRRKKLNDFLSIGYSFIFTIAVLGGGGWALWTYVIKPRIDENQKSSKLDAEERERTKLLMGR